MVVAGARDCVVDCIVAIPSLTPAAAPVQYTCAAAASKRQRRDSGSDRDSGSGGPPPSPRLAEEVPDWVEQLDETSTQALFERALFHHLADIIAGRPTLRDELLQAYVQRQ